MIRISHRLQIALGLSLALVSTTGADPSFEGPAEVVHDFFPGEFVGGWTQPQFTELGDVLFFVADDLDTGEGVWRTDGTPAGTRRIPVPGESALGGDSKILGVLGSRVLWSRSTGEILRPRALASASRRGRGTILATFRPKDAYEPPGFVGGLFFFQDCTDTACTIWSTDGTAPGTAPVHTLTDQFPAGQEILTTLANRWLVFRSRNTLYAFDVPQNRVLLLLPQGAQSLGSNRIHPVGEKLFFVTYDDSPDRTRLWVSRLSAPRASQIFSDKFLYIAGWRENRLYFIPENQQLWSTEGTRESTKPYPGARIEPYTVLADRLGTLGPITFFPVPGYYSGGLFRADETRSRLREIHHTCSGKYVCLGSSMSGVTVAGNQGYLTIERSLWQSDGTPKGTRPHDVLGPADASTFRAVGDRLVLGATSHDGEEQLWETDGTAAGTRALSDPRLGPFGVRGRPIPFAGAIYASATRPGIGQQIWRLTEGRDTQVTLLRHLAKGLDPTLAIPVGGRLVIASYESNGWVGLAENGSTEKLPVYEDGCSSFFENPCPRTRVLLGRRLLFIPQYVPQLQSTDGTAAGTVTLAPSAVALGRFSDRALVLDREGGLWTSDGTAGGTRRFAKLPAGSDPYWTEQPAGPPVASGSQAFLFRQIPLDADLAALELWRTDGTETGTFRLASLPFDRELTPFPSPALVGGRLFFRFRGTLWRSDGSVEGTEPLPDLLPDATFAMAAGPGTLYAATDQTEEKQQTLWAIDPQTLQKARLGTFDRVANGYVGTTFGNVLGNAFLFWVTQDNVEGWWVTAGTPESTRPLPEPLGKANGTVRLFTARDHLYFPAYDSEHGWELWSSDRFGDNARLVQDFWPGPQNGFPEILAVTDDAIWIAATEPTVGRELWKIDLSKGKP